MSGHGNFLKFAVNTVTNFEFVLERFEVDVGGAQFNRVLQNLIDEANDGRLVFRAVVEIVAFGIFVDDGDAFFFFQRADGVSTDTEIFFNFALDGFADCENRLEVKTSQGFQRVKTLRGKKAAGGDFNGTVVAFERKQFFLQQDARRKKRKQLTIRLDVFERREAEAVFGRKPAENFLLARELQMRSRECFRVQCGKLPGRDHASQQLFCRILNRIGGHESSAFFLKSFSSPNRADKPAPPASRSKWL